MPAACCAHGTAGGAGRQGGAPRRAPWPRTVPPYDSVPAACPGAASYYAPETPGEGRPTSGPKSDAPPERRAGDLTHVMVQLDESAIAGNVGRDLAYAASRLAARSHPGVGGCAAPSSLVIFGISQPNARWTAGCSSPSGQRCSLHARTRHERAHICRGDDGRVAIARYSVQPTRGNRVAKGRLRGWHTRASVWIATSFRPCSREHAHGIA